MTTFHWVRHGPTHERAFVGWRDVPADLSDTAQIARLNRFLPGDAVVVASDLIRATATADVLSAGRTRLPDLPELREFHFGDWDGRHFSDVAKSHPALSRAYWETPGDPMPPGGESWNMAAQRIRPAVDRLIETHRGGHIIAVAHIGVIMTQIERATGQPAQQVIGNRIDNLSITELHLADAGWQVRRINHLP
ncbi:histidine phosphatase family protein [Microbulbifer sp. S227A]|uniref:histidine phosphatase family protein n=1 Tax=Microbulbifer sp. S227A TaxID=3415131 RepID=UPI003C7E93EB